VSFDVLVVGGGHAGTEAALAAARLGVRTALITQDPEKMGLMSCNPAIGGIGKGHLVKEIDALGGEMGRNTDATAIQFRTLNTRKGPAVRATRAQCDRALYARRLGTVIREDPGVTVVKGEVVGLVTRKDGVKAVRLADGRELESATVVLTTGTFLEGLLHFGDDQRPGGRIGDAPSTGLSGCLRDLGFPVGRLKTGTPPRLLEDSLDLDAMTRQDSDPGAGPFSLWGGGTSLPRRPCWVTATTGRTHEVIRSNLHRAPLFTGAIKGQGPRYCPSIEDKVVRFAHHDSHRVFVEPEGLDSPEVYPNGLSTSLPLSVQEEYVRTIPGLERAEITQPGYAVEYDFVDPREVGSDLQALRVPGLFLAGQVLGTTGYEEAGALGLLAGANAALITRKAPPLFFNRAEAYLGVMVDDLVTRGVTEPYRMFTSRAEFRLNLREDNAADRLAPRAAAVGLLPDRARGLYEARTERLDYARRSLEAVRVSSSNPRLADLGQSLPREGLTLLEILRRPDVTVDSLAPFEEGDALDALTPEERTALAIRVRYEGYLVHEQREVERFARLEALEIPADLDFTTVPGLSLEVRERLKQYRPRTLGLASRMEGVTPAAVAALLIRVRAPTSADGPNRVKKEV